MSLDVHNDTLGVTFDKITEILDELNKKLSQIPDDMSEESSRIVESINKISIDLSNLRKEFIELSNSDEYFSTFNQIFK